MRTLATRERNAVQGFLDEIDDQLATARKSVERAADGRADLASVELDFAQSALDEITDIAEVLTGYLVRLIKSTHNARQAGSGHGLVPPRRGVYTFDDETDAEDVERVGAA